MSLKETSMKVFTRLPTVRGPTGHVAFRKKLAWTLGVLALYFFLTNVPIWGLAEGGSDVFGQFRSVLAGQQGSVLQLGIGPIVTAGIVLQLLAGADLLGLDMNDPRDQQFYQGLQKFLVIVMTVFTAVPMIFGGGFLPASGALAGAFGVPVAIIQLVMLAQIVFGGILILYMDEIVSKWGIGSGVGLFIIAGVAQQLIGGIFAQILPNWYGIITGDIAASPFTADGLQTLVFGAGSLLAIATTALIFFVVVYAESTRVEIPISNARVKGARGRFPVKLIYASVMPLILVRAVQANVQFLGRLLNAQLGGSMPAWLGTYANGQPTGGLFYFLNPVYSPEQWMWWLGTATAEPWEILIRVAIDLTWLVLGGAVFAVFWVETTGMGAESSAEQIQNSGLQIPGFRQNTSVIEKVLERYIPYVTIIGGALVGLLAVMANLFGAIGGVSGTGLLLAVSISYKMYEEMAEEKLMEMNSQFRQLLGN